MRSAWSWRTKRWPTLNGSTRCRTRSERVLPSRAFRSRSRTTPMSPDSQRCGARPSTEASATPTQKSCGVCGGRARSSSGRRTSPSSRCGRGQNRLHGAPHTTRGISTARQVARRVARPQRSARAWPRWRSAATAADRFDTPQDSRGWSGSSLKGTGFRSATNTGRGGTD